MIFELQSWTSIEGELGDDVPQTSSPLALDGYQDVSFYLEVARAAAGGTLTMHYDTATSVDPTNFKSMGSATMVVAANPIVTRVRLSDNPTTPLASLVRWRIDPPGAFTATFRIECLAKRARGGA